MGLIEAECQASVGMKGDVDTGAHWLCQFVHVRTCPRACMCVRVRACACVVQCSAGATRP